ncbi:hypothetical protein [Larkinella rosea]|uniref:Uncharacterized protein n=1 Tax=Larkinella rosea TaxID=2025312 RepID=A0A3P1B9Z1_9BACT|nr:hypothetical protein [Larkinella rosea]RRA97592.1 hypothetical protein EHT25_31570 [Larkinella rosea]
MKKRTLVIRLVSLAGLACGPEPNASAESSEWFPYFDFDAATFQKAPRAFGPFTRWWLPGNAITSEELRRTIKVLADNGFAGVEVQPLTIGTNPKARWQAPADINGRIVVAGSIPTVGNPSFIASSKTNYVIDHLDPMIVDKTYDYLLPENDNIKTATGNDSYEVSPYGWMERYASGNDQRTYKSDESVYSASFTQKTVDPAMHYGVALGKVFFTANVSVYGKSVGKRLFAPYQLDVTKFPKPGENTLTVQVTTSRRNGFIGEAVRRNEKYAQFRGKKIHYFRPDWPNRFVFRESVGTVSQNDFKIKTGSLPVVFGQIVTVLN